MIHRKRITAKNALSHEFFQSELPKMTLKTEMSSFEKHHVKQRRKGKRLYDVGQFSLAEMRSLSCKLIIVEMRTNR